jgi:hypothetical protein
MAESDRTTTETMKLIKPQTSEAVMIADINNNSQVIDNVFANGRLFKSIAPGDGVTGSAVVARTNEDIIKISDSVENYGDTLTVGCEKGISIALDSGSRKMTISHANAGIESGSRGNNYTIPIIGWDGQGHLTSVRSSTVYPPDTPGTPGQVWISVERPSDEPNKKGAWATLSTDGIIKATPPTMESTNTSISITHAKADSNRVNTSVGASNLVPVIKYDEYGHIIDASTHTIYPPTTKGVTNQIWVAVGTDSTDNGVWKDQSALYVGKSKLSDETTRLVKSSDKGDELTPVYFKDGVPALCTRRIPNFSNSTHISYKESENEMISFSLTGDFETPPIDTVGDKLITAGWVLEKVKGKQDAALEFNAALKADRWTPITADEGASLQQTVEIADLKPGAIVLVSPTDGSEDLWYDCGVYTLAQGNGWLQFHSDFIPSEDIRIQVAWLPKST